MTNIIVTESLIAGAFGSATGPIWMSGLTCVGTEVSLFDCSSTIQLGWVQNTTSCTHSNDVAVRCQGLPSGIISFAEYSISSNFGVTFLFTTNLHVCHSFTIGCTSAEQGIIRLANGSTPYEGRVELCYNNQWGTVCDDSWGTIDAGMACQQLGFSPWGKKYTS